VDIWEFLLDELLEDAAYDLLIWSLIASPWPCRALCLCVLLIWVLANY
jgi:hypothetical protein